MKDEYKQKLLKVKVYDKILDLIGRDHHHTVGTRVPQILGTGFKDDLFQKRIKKSQSTGLTRLEVSVLHEAISQYDIFKPSVKTLCHEKVPKAMSLMVENILNHDYVLRLAYCKLSLNYLFAYLAKAQTNIMAIGSKSTFMINARTGHNRHFVGTHKPIGLTTSASN